MPTTKPVSRSASQSRAGKRSKSPGRTPVGARVARTTSRSRSRSRGRQEPKSSAASAKVFQNGDAPKSKSRSSSRGRPKSPGRTGMQVYKAVGNKGGPLSSPKKSTLDLMTTMAEKYYTPKKLKSTLTPLIKQGATSAMKTATLVGKQASKEINKIGKTIHHALESESPDHGLIPIHLRKNINHELHELSHMGKQALSQARLYASPKLEFGGPLGTLILMGFLPAFVLYTLHLCDKKLFSLWKIPHFRREPMHYFDTWSLVAFTAWMLFQAILYVLPIGPKAKGVPLAPGQPPLIYRCNGLYAYILTLVLFGAALYFGLPVWKVCNHVIPLACISTLFSFLFAGYLHFMHPKSQNDMLDPSGLDRQLDNANVKGKGIYRYFMGRHKNPRFGRDFDLKMFFEMRPGLIAWILLDLCYLAQKTVEHRFLSLPLLCLTLLQAWYVLDAQWNEERVLSTWDIRHEGLGWMLLFGDIVWVPFLYSLQARYLAYHTVVVPKWHLAACIALYFVGYAIFRMSNTEKALYTRSPNHPKFSNYRTIPTNQGKKLLAGGWWSLVRHPNYLGDIIIALSMCLLSGYDHVLPYFYFFFLTSLLIHRQIRDEAWCQAKYGKAWDEYKSIVKHRIIPYIY